MKAFEEVLASFQVMLSTVPDKPEESARSTLAALWHFAQGRKISSHLASPNACLPLESEHEECLQDLMTRRLAGEPLAYITGRQHFMGLEMLAESGALIPRRETEVLGRTAIELVQEVAARGESAEVLDVCTGSGNLALAIAHYVTTARVRAADISIDAVDAARRNAAFLHLQERVEFRQGDLMEPFAGSEFAGVFDVLMCNPPYISSSRLGSMPGEIIAHEPKVAFDGGPLGVQILNRILRESPAYLKAGGYLVIEVGKGQGPSVLRRLGNSTAFSHARGVVDAHADLRVVVARRA